jgi:hypothetical protein
MATKPPSMQDLLTGGLTQVNGSPANGDGGFFNGPVQGGIYQDKNGLQWVWNQGQFTQLGGTQQPAEQPDPNAYQYDPSAWDERFLKRYKAARPYIGGGISDPWDSASQFAQGWQDYTGRAFSKSSAKDPRFKEFAQLRPFEALGSSFDEPVFKGAQRREAKDLYDMGISSLAGMGPERRHFYNTPVRWRPGEPVKPKKDEK